MLLRHGANPMDREDKYWGTPAGWAAHAGHIAVRDVILDAPAIDIFDAILYRGDRIGATLDRDPSALDRVFGERHVTVQYVAELDNIEMVKRLVEVGAGIAVIPEKSCEHEVRAGTLVKVELSDKDLTRPIGIIYRTGKHFSPAVEKFIEYLQAEPAQVRNRQQLAGARKAAQR